MIQNEAVKHVTQKLIKVMIYEIKNYTYIILIYFRPCELKDRLVFKAALMDNRGKFIVLCLVYYVFIKQTDGEINNFELNEELFHSRIKFIVNYLL